MGGCDALDHYTHPRTPSMRSLLRSLSLACHHPRTHSPLRSPSRRHGPPPIKRARRPVSSYGPQSHLTHDALDYEFQACRNHRQLEQLLSRSLKGAYSRLARVNIYSGYLVSLASDRLEGSACNTQIYSEFPVRPWLDATRGLSYQRDKKRSGPVCQKTPFRRTLIAFKFLIDF